jgi:hypothetical protein
MTVRRIPLLIVVLLAIAGAVLAGRDRSAAEIPSFSTAATGWMPFAPPVGGVTETWFCPGVPSTGVDDVRGVLQIANRTGEQRIGTVLLLNEGAENRRLELAIDPWQIAVVDIAAQLPGAMVGAVVEIDGGGALVEQQALNPAGDSAAACANATSDTWYLADGFTVEGSLDQIVLTNPYDQTVVASLEFATQEGSREPGSYRSLAVEARSTRVVDLGAPGAGAQGEPVLAVAVRTSNGRLVVGRSQRFLGGGRAGAQVTVAQPAPRDQWWFANGHKGGGVSDRYSIYNPTDDDVEVDPIFLGIPTAIQLDPIAVPAHEVVTFEPGTVAELPDGRHAVVFSSVAQSSVVVERASTAIVGDETFTTVVAGAPPRPVGDAVAATWYVPRAPADATEAALIVYNFNNEPGTLTVSAVGASGPVPVPGLTDLVVPAPDSTLAIDLTDPILLGRPLVIESTNRVFVERSFPSGRGDTRTASWAIPAG